MSPRAPITREPAGDGFTYRLRGRRITSRSELRRIAALAIPPAWTDVEIARSPRAKVQASGVDAAGRTQRIYDPAFARRMQRAKFARLRRFGRALPRLRARVDRDLRRRRLSRDRVTACVVRLIDRQLFRVGGAEYGDASGGCGATTLLDRHVGIAHGGIDFDFAAKSGKRVERRVRDPRLARLVARLLEIPGPEVFRFFDEDGVVRNLRSAHVNGYIKRSMGEEFTAKDFRTWGATVLAAGALFALEPGELPDKGLRRDALRDGIRRAAARLGNTATVARSSYVDPRVLEAVDRPELVRRAVEDRARPSRRLTLDERRTIRLLEEMDRAGPRRGRG